MLAQIVIDCQTQTDQLVCEYCLVNKRCLPRTTLSKFDKKESKDEFYIINAYFPISISN